MMHSLYTFEEYLKVHIVEALRSKTSNKNRNRSLLPMVGAMTMKVLVEKPEFNNEFFVKD